MSLFGYTILVVGAITCLYGQLRFLAVAYNRNLWLFFGCLFLPFVNLIFFLLNMKATTKPFVVSLAGLIMAAFGAWVAEIHCQS